MAINFPDSPTIGDEFTGGGFTWTWNGSSWEKLVASTSSASSENYFLVKSNLDFFDTSSLGAGLFIVTATADSGSFGSPSLTFFDENNAELASFSSSSATYYSSVTVSKIRFTNTSSVGGRVTLVHGPVSVVNVQKILSSRTVTIDSAVTVYAFGGGGGGGGGAPNSPGGGGGGSGYIATGNLPAGTYTATIGAGGNGGYYNTGGVGGATSIGDVVASGGNPGSGSVDSFGGDGGSGGGDGGTGGSPLGGANGANGGATGFGYGTGGVGSGVTIPVFAGNYPSSMIFPESVAGTSQRSAGIFYAGGSGAQSVGYGSAAGANSASGGGGGLASSGNIQKGENGGSGLIFLVGA